MTSRKEARKVGKYAGVAGIVSVFFMALTLCAPSAATAGSPIPGYAQKVAGADIGSGDSWSIWIFGHRHTDQCWATKTAGGGSGSEEALCGFDVPTHPWQLAAKGTFGSGQRQESMLFFLTRESVVRLKVQVEQGHNHQVWMHLATRHLSSRAASHAQIEPNFSYAVGRTSGPLSCVKRVIATTRSGKKISRGKASSCSTRRRHQ
jgi:hypothetical protein